MANPYQASNVNQLAPYTTPVSVCVRVSVYVWVCSDLETLSEKREDIQDTQAHLGGHVALQQSLMVDFCF